MKRNNFSSSNLSSPKIPAKKQSASKSWHAFLKICIVLIWIVVIFFLSVGMISGFKGFFDTEVMPERLRVGDTDTGDEIKKQIGQ